MQIWILIAIGAHFLNAITAVIDKHIVSNKVMKPVVYAFYSGIFQILYLLAIPILAAVYPEIEFRFPSWGLFAWAVLGGALSIYALCAYYRAIRASEVSRVTPIVGVSVPVFTYLLSLLFLGQGLSSRQLIAFAFFVAGGFLMSARISRGRITEIRGASRAVMAGFLFAAYYVIMKYVFAQVGFLDAFMIIQFGGFLGAASLLISSSSRHAIFTMKDEENDIIENKTSAALFLYDKVTAAVAALMLTYAISIGNVVIINSLQSVQYVFTLLLAIVLSRKLPALFHEQTGPDVVMQKSVALVLIACGLLLIA